MLFNAFFYRNANVRLAARQSSSIVLLERVCMGKTPTHARVGFKHLGGCIFLFVKCVKIFGS